jgi:hypothetical protein
MNLQISCIILIYIISLLNSQQLETKLPDVIQNDDINREIVFLEDNEESELDSTPMQIFIGEETSQSNVDTPVPVEKKGDLDFLTDSYRNENTNNVGGTDINYNSTTDNNDSSLFQKFYSNVIALFQQKEFYGSKTGSLITNLPVSELLKPKGGAFNTGRDVIFGSGKIITFEGEKVLSVFYEKGTGTSKDKKPKLGRFDFTAVPKGLPSKSAVIRFQVYFAPGWDFSKGGKLSGLSVGDGVSSGYRRSDDGASNRMMWQSNGGAISYVYPPKDLDQVDPKLAKTEHGYGYFQELFPAGTLKVGRWHTIEIGIKLNTFSNNKPNADGVGYLAIDGKSGVISNIRWSKFIDLKITKFSFSSFFGGPAPAATNCYAYFKNYELRNWKD